MNEFTTDWQMELLHGPKTREEPRVPLDRKSGDNRSAFILTTDPDSWNDAQDRAATFGFDLQVCLPREPLPTVAGALFVALDELLLDANGRREYLARLLAIRLPFPVIVVGSDFAADGSTVVRPGLMLAVRLDEHVFRALRDGHIDPPDEDEGRKAA